MTDKAASPVPSACLSCGETDERCPESQRSCGHHCNCAPVHAECHWCGKTFGDDECGHPADAVMWNPYNGVTQCHRCGQVVTEQANTDSPSEGRRV